MERPKAANVIHRTGDEEENCSTEFEIDDAQYSNYLCDLLANDEDEIARLGKEIAGNKNEAKRKQKVALEMPSLKESLNEKVAELIEQFVRKSNKRWAHISEMTSELLAHELQEKQQILANRKLEHGIGLALLKPIDFVYGQRRNAFILSGQIIDNVLFGIEISMSLLGVPTEIVQNELDEQTQLSIRHSACKLISAKPMFDGLAKNVDNFNEFLTKRLGIDNPKLFCIVQSIKKFLKAPDNESLPNDSEQSMQLANLNIYIQFYKSMQRFCDLFHTEPNVHNEQIFREVFGTLCAFIRTIIRQFSEYCEMAQRDGFDQLKADICQ
uniref:Uncharacterized protein n=1 Tax=Globodera rostochiensis TaxID=31243 RepID=A0A914H3K0_GLORO